MIIITVKVKSNTNVAAFPVHLTYLEENEDYLLTSFYSPKDTAATKW